MQGSICASLEPGVYPFRESARRVGKPCQSWPRYFLGNAMHAGLLATLASAPELDVGVRQSPAVSVSGPWATETSAAAIDADDWRQTVPPSSQIRFFVYSGALNQSWLRRCPGFNALEISTATEKLGEVRLFDALEHHRLRTRDVSQATFFYMPLWEYTSWALGYCRGTTHTERMAAAAEQLAASPHYQLHGGKNHVWGSTASTIDGAVLNDRLQPLTPLLRWTVAGRYKPFERSNFDSGSNGGKCVIQLPFPALATAVAAFPSADAPKVGRRRTTLLFFAGAVDGVCCTGALVRCAVAELWGMTRGNPAHADVVIRPSLRSRGAPQPCLEKARRKYAHALDSRAGAAAAVVTPPSGEKGHATIMAARATRSVAARTGTAYGSSVFCLAPAGDMCVSSRINSALAAGCIPVLLCDEWPGAFSDVVPYHSIIVRRLVRCAASVARQLAPPASLGGEHRVWPALQAKGEPPSHLARSQRLKHRHQVALKLPISTFNTRCASTSKLFYATPPTPCAPSGPCHHARLRDGSTCWPPTART